MFGAGAQCDAGAIIRVCHGYVYTHIPIETWKTVFQFACHSSASANKIVAFIRDLKNIWIHCIPKCIIAKAIIAEGRNDVMEIVLAKILLSPLDVEDAKL
jgi:hypothetical protein